MSEDNNIAPNNNGDNVSGNNQGNTSTGKARQNDNGRQNITQKLEVVFV